MSGNILGISAHFHNSACCLFRDGVLVAAAQEERFTRIRHDASIPSSAARFCLAAANLTIADIDCVAYYERPARRLERQLAQFLANARGLRQPTPAKLDPNRPERDIREAIGFDGAIFYAEHHRAHAAGCYHPSGFREAAILTVDGVGEQETISYAIGKERKLEVLERVDFPDSPALLYSTVVGFLGFAVNGDELKVMGLAAQGQPHYVSRLRSMIASTEGGRFRLRLEYFDLNRTDRMYSDRMVSLLKCAPRAPGGAITQKDRDLASSLQAVIEEILLEESRYIFRKTGSENLCMAGSLALNDAAMRRVRKEGPFKRVFVQPAADDAGACLGAALEAMTAMPATCPHPKVMQHVFLGPRYSIPEIRSLVSRIPRTRDYSENEPGLLDATAERLAAGKIVGWYHGAMEFGPRTLGARSILADPRRPEMKERLISRIKKCEPFRAFGPSVLLSEAGKHFDLTGPSPFMQEIGPVRSPISLPAVTHSDGTARVHTVKAEDSPRFAALLSAFQARTGCPMLLNTSFNVAGEPVVCTPMDAMACFVRSGLDCLVLEDFVIDAADIPQNFREYFAGPVWKGDPSYHRNNHTFF